MTEQPKFQAPPLPPRAPAFGIQTNAAQPVVKPVVEKTDEKPETISEIPADNFAARLKLPTSIFQTKIMAAILGGAVLLGMLLGAMLFGGGGSSQPQVVQGLLGVVGNPDIRQDMPRCGWVAESSPCAVFIMNHSRNDRYAEYFFDEATKLTGRQKYLITIENQHYAKARIPPGHIAQIKIPPLR